ncbi:MAG: hypothetical protein IJ436_00870 [Bacteroidaceae bacterium]|nr:hypothetical protein [Bacteroidaceae bacterium]
MKHFPIVDAMMNEMKLYGILCDKRNALATIMNEEYNEKTPRTNEEQLFLHIEFSH